MDGLPTEVRLMNGARLRTASLGLGLCSLALVASLALTDPGVRVSYVAGVPQIELEGSYPHSRYSVYRSASATDPGERITSLDVLCLGPCYAQDVEAEPGHTYWYHFDLTLSDGSFARFGPYAVTISPELASRVAVAIRPNPVRASARIDLRILGRPSDPAVMARVVVMDLQGRTVRTMYRGSLPRGTTSFTWDGRDDRSRRTPSGTYFLRAVTPLGSAVERLLRLD